jgi:hypothetical protein
MAVMPVTVTAQPASAGVCRNLFDGYVYGFGVLIYTSRIISMARRRR